MGDKVARDAFVNWQGSRYSVPWRYAGKEVWLRPKANGLLEVHYGERQIARHALASGRHQIVIDAAPHTGIPAGARASGKTLVHIRDEAPVVEIRPLAVYESAGGGR